MKNLLELKIERELRTTYIVAAKKAKTIAKASKVLVAWLPRLANAWGQENLAMTHTPSLEIPEMRSVHHSHSLFW